MKTNSLMDSIRQSTPPEVNKQVDMCVSIANRVYEILEERGMSQKDFAKLLGKTETEVSRWLSGTHNITLATIAKMSVALGDDIITTTHNQHNEVHYQEIASQEVYDSAFVAESHQQYR